MPRWRSTLKKPPDLRIVSTSDSFCRVLFPIEGMCTSASSKSLLLPPYPLWLCFGNGGGVLGWDGVHGDFSDFPSSPWLGAFECVDKGPACVWLDLRLGLNVGIVFKKGLMANGSCLMYHLLYRRLAPCRRSLVSGIKVDKVSWRTTKNFPKRHRQNVKATQVARFVYATTAKNPIAPDSGARSWCCDLVMSSVDNLDLLAR